MKNQINVARSARRESSQNRRYPDEVDRSTVA